jgi:hypothetical protein
MVTPVTKSAGTTTHAANNTQAAVLLARLELPATLTSDTSFNCTAAVSSEAVVVVIVGVCFTAGKARLLVLLLLLAPPVLLLVALVLQQSVVRLW